jgi:retron-type reverse transcriptase
LRGLAEAVRVTVEAFRVLLEATRVIIEAVRKIIKAVRLFVEGRETGRVLRSSANKSIPIDPRLRNNFLHSQFDPVKKLSYLHSRGLCRTLFSLRSCHV